MALGFSRRRASEDDPMPLRTRQQELEDASRRAFAEEFLSSVNDMLEEALPEKPEIGFEVRFVNKDEPVESVHLPPPGRRA